MSRFFLEGGGVASLIASRRYYGSAKDDQRLREGGKDREEGIEVACPGSLEAAADGSLTEF